MRKPQPAPNRSHERTPNPLQNQCPDCDGVDRMARAMERVASGIEEALPALQVIHDLAGRLDRLCAFVRRRGPWILASIPVVLSSVGAITPQLANGLKALIATIFPAG